MNLDGGTVRILRQRNTAQAGEMPTYEWEQIFESFFGERTVGMNRYYTAKAQNDQIDMLIEIAPTRILSTATDRAVIDKGFLGIPVEEGEDPDVYFRIVQIQQTDGDDYLPVTQLSLERVAGLE